MYYRRKILLSLLSEMGGKLKRTDMQKLLFLFCQRQVEKSYEFVPYKYGGFSFQSYADKRTLMKYGFLYDIEDWELTDKAITTSFDLKKGDIQTLHLFKKEYNKLRGKNLVKDAYIKYPYYAIKSEIIENVLDKDERNIVKKHLPKQQDYAFFTIGYEGISLEKYLNKLIQNNIKLLCDVRKNPLSMKYGFSKNQLKYACIELGIGYKHFPELGISSKNRKHLKTNQDYKILFNEYDRTTLITEHNSIVYLSNLIVKYKRIAITCFEETANKCHRSRVAEAVSKIPEWNIPIMHL